MWKLTTIAPEDASFWHDWNWNWVFFSALRLSTSFKFPADFTEPMIGDVEQFSAYSI